MARVTLTGTRIRERRIAAGIRQADMARAAGISPAYLNLIEHNRRTPGTELVGTLARVMGLDPELIDDGAEAQLFDQLREAAQDARPPALPETARIEEFVGRFPGWAALLAGRQTRLAALERTVELLSERMTHDPFLSASLHEILSAVTAVRSTAAILAEIDEIEPEWRARFHRNIHADSVRLSEAAAALVAYLAATHEREAGLSSPQEMVEAWLAAQDFHLPALEAALASGAEPDVSAMIAAAPELATEAARDLARVFVARYRADALMLPLRRFLPAVADSGPDPAALAARFGCDLAPVLRRLAGLPPTEGVPAVGLIACDATGAPTFRRPLPGFAVPRYGAACPLWPIYEAMARPGTPLRRHLDFAGRAPRRFLAYAVSRAEH